jgi:rod shape-determining protein MreC
VVKQYLVTALLTLISLVLFFGTTGQRVAKAQVIGRTVYYPFLAPLHTAESLLKAHNENRSLLKERAELLLKVASLENRLASQLQLQPAVGDTLTPFVLAEVIGYSGSLRERGLVIDKGSSDGVLLNYPVVGGNGIVGKIVSILPRQSVVLPIDHPSFRVGVLDKTTRVEGILETDSDGRVIVSFFRSNAKVAVGDTILTSNISRVFPKGLPVGRILSVGMSTENSYTKAIIKPFAEPADMEHVFVLQFHKDLTDITESEEPESAPTETGEY